MRLVHVSLVVLLVLSLVSLPPESIALAGDSNVEQKTEKLSLVLQKMSDEERSNARIDILLPSSASAEAVGAATSISSAWNEGLYTAALERLPELAELIDLDGVGIVKSWRTPVATPTETLWDADVAISARDSVFAIDMDIDRSSGKLFVALLFDGESVAGNLGVYFSEDNGASWYESAHLVSLVNSVPDLGAAVVDDRFYVVLGWSEATAARLLAFDVADGSWVNLDDGHDQMDIFTVSSPDYLKEIELISLEDRELGSLDLLAITSGGDLLHYRCTADWDDTDWWSRNTGITNADRGLGATFNVGSSIHWVLVSFINASDRLIVKGYASSAWGSSLTEYALSSGPDVTSISAYQDTVVVVFEMSDIAVHRYSYDGGYSWGPVINFVGTGTAVSPTVCLREGGGVAVSYAKRTMYVTGPPYFNWRPMSAIDDLTASGTDVKGSNWMSNVRPELLHVGNSRYALAYLSSTDNDRAWFDIGSSCCGYFSSGITGNANCSDDGKLTLSDISRMIDYLYISKANLCCYPAGNTNGSWDEGECKVTLSDISRLIDVLYISKLPPADCMPECER